MLSAGIPDMPSAPRVVAATETQITIEWDIVYGGGVPITGYQILMAAVPTTVARRLLQELVWVDITNSGSLNLSTRRFTTANNLLPGF